jgi:class 3 adenylate cyclase/tetratricopeptide (TPR) repeat protein
MQDKDIEDLRAAIAALEGQRATLGDSVLDLATAPLRARLASLLRPAGLQHRQVTVVFADVVGSTALAQGMDAEDTLALLSEALRRMADIVHAHQGRVLRFTGDGVKAAFGMDEAREDDAERAVRAALAILSTGREQADIARRQHGVTDFAVRVGVHTGDVALGAGVEADNTAMGAAVNIAARMEQTAPPGALRISHDTWSQVRGLFDLQPQPPLLVKGVDAPMQTYLVHAALERSVASVERGLQGLRTPMVGRDAELQRLLETVASAREARQLQAVTLLGDAGLGKSRLLRDLTGRLTECRVLTLRSQPDGLLRPWGLLRSLLATQFGVADTDSADAARRKVVEGLSPWFEERGERQAQLIGQLSGLDFGDSPSLRGLDPRTLRDQAFVALRAYLKALAAPGRALPVLIVEDLHWADDGSLDLLQHLLSHGAGLPLALIMTSRPPLLARRAGWGTPETTVRLSPLPAAQSDELARALLHRVATVPPRLAELVVRRGEGNPYYMEELVRRLIDDGVILADGADGSVWAVQADHLDKVRLPGTLVGLLQARLDALPAGERQAARQASVIGHVFWDDALQALDADAPRAMPALRRAGFVRDHDTSDFEGTPERQFDHHLLHEVTYDTLLKAERRRGHSAAARWLAERTKGRGAEFLAMTGEHAERAGETALAIDCFAQAGKDAERRFANTAAQSWLRRAVTLLAESDPMRSIDLLHTLVAVSDAVGDPSAQGALHAEVSALLERHPEDHRLAENLVRRALLADRLGDEAASEPLARQAFEIAERSGSARWAAMAKGQLTWLHCMRHDYAGARSHLDIGLQWAGRIPEEHRRAETEAQLQMLSATILTDLCRFDEARGAFLTALARGESIRSPRLQLGAMDMLAEVAGTLGHWAEMADWAERALVLADSVGVRRDMAVAQLWAARAAHSLGDHARAIDWCEQVLSSARDTGARRYEALALNLLGDAHRELGELASALPWYLKAQALHETLEDPIAACQALAGSALCQARLGQPEAALSTVNAVLARLGSDQAETPAHATIELRWTCRQVLDALGDAGATPMLEQLSVDLQARSAQLAPDKAERARLIQAMPVFRSIMAAHGVREEPAARG